MFYAFNHCGSLSGREFIKKLPYVQMVTLVNCSQSHANVVAPNNVYFTHSIKCTSCPPRCVGVPGSRNMIGREK